MYKYFVGKICSIIENRIIIYIANFRKKSVDKDIKTIQKEMREVIRQITASVTFLPLLDTLCKF